MDASKFYQLCVYVCVCLCVCVCVCVCLWNELNELILQPTRLSYSHNNEQMNSKIQL